SEHLAWFFVSGMVAIPLSVGIAWITLRLVLYNDDPEAILAFTTFCFWIPLIVLMCIARYVLEDVVRVSCPRCQHRVTPIFCRFRFINIYDYDCESCGFEQEGFSPRE
ncbi:hypothetical protein OAS39_09945, partial [Pirellulales bacterium]|nr:hypothetical protein [Pirellulales bacterium]